MATRSVPQAISKSLYAFNLNVKSFIDYFGVENCGFLTLTFADDVKDVREASKRFNSMRTNFLSKHVLGYIGVYERTKRGRIHFHFVVAMKFEIANGFNWANYELARKGIRGLKITTNSDLSEFWSLMRSQLVNYGFGSINELTPIRSAGGAARYLAKYLLKGFEFRREDDKGFRFVRSSRGTADTWRACTCNFAWVGKGSSYWRSALKFFVEGTAKKVGVFNSFYAQKGNNGIFTVRSELFCMNERNYSDILKKVYGAKWCYFLKDEILKLYEQFQGNEFLLLEEYKNHCREAWNGSLVS